MSLRFVRQPITQNGKVFSAVDIAFNWRMYRFWTGPMGLLRVKKV